MVPSGLGGSPRRYAPNDIERNLCRWDWPSEDGSGIRAWR